MGFSRQEYWSGVPLPSPMIWVFVHKYAEYAHLFIHATNDFLGNSQGFRGVGHAYDLVNAGALG